MTLKRIKHFFIGKPLDPFKSDVRSHIALIAFFAWIGLGADGISSSAYGPEEAFVALGQHQELAVFLAIATGITVFLIALAYLQVIELFPQGGGGYRVASKLLGARAGLVAGSAMIIDYVLTIAISLASATDSFFSVLPKDWQPYKLGMEIFLVLVLVQMNLRGMKESIKILMPIFLGFIITHVILILYGVGVHAEGLSNLIPNAIADSESMSSKVGWMGVLAIFLKAFSMGGGTYTGLESITNNVNSMAEPRVRTGKITMVMVAFSLAFMATGVILLYLLWGVTKIPGETMNATTFGKITADWMIGGIALSEPIVALTMFLTAGLLFVAGNTGFIAGPTVLANMAVDRWMPHMFSALSSRLVTKNGVLLMGGAAIAALFITGGEVHLLVVLYSINVFLTFSLSLAGIIRYRWRRRRRFEHLRNLVLPLLAFIICASILMVTLYEKFLTGGWMTVLITGLLIFIGTRIKNHYTHVQEQVEEREDGLTRMLEESCPVINDLYKLDSSKPTAVFFVGETAASGTNTLLWVLKTFPGMFHNFVFASVGEIDTEEFVDQQKWNNLRRDTKKTLKSYVDFCEQHGMPSTYYHAYGTDVVEQLTDLSNKISDKFPTSIFFATKIISDNENILTQLLHNQTAYIMQRRLHNLGKALIIMPMKV
jgi:amino acid transporter